jgi:hypothetical protein
MSSLHPKFSISIYNGVEFNTDSYSNSRNFAVYTPKPNNAMRDIIDRHQAKLRAEQLQQEKAGQQLRNRRGLVSSCTTSPRNNQTCTQSPTINPLNSRLLQNFEGSVLSSEEESQVRAKLNNDIQLANFVLENSKKFGSSGFKTEREESDVQILTESLVSQQATMTSRETTPTNQTKVQSVHHKKGKSMDKGLPLKKIHFDLTSDSFLKQSLNPTPRMRSVTKRESSKVIEDILDQEIQIMKKPDLVKSIFKLRDIQVLKVPQLNLQKSPGNGRVQYIYNDYHTKNSNPGFSRNTAGVFYCK